MAILVRDISLALHEDESTAFTKALAILGIKQDDCAKLYIAKKAIDARKKNDIKLVYTIGAQLNVPEREALLTKTLKNAHVALAQPEEWQMKQGTQKLQSRPVVVGFGPAGMFAGLLLAQQGYRPILIERGADVDTRTAHVQSFWQSGVLNTSSNVQFGEGGAGTFSDGKLTTRIGDPLCAHILREFVRFGAPDDILYKAKPHIGTDYLRRVVKALRQEIIALGGEVRFNCQLTGLILTNEKLCGIHTTKGDIETTNLILAIGHSARDTFKMLHESNITLQPKPFSVGLRIEHLQTALDQSLYGQHAGHPKLGSSSYQLSHREGNRAVYTFCMCPGGVVVPAASSEGELVVNGMSEYARSAPNANSAVVVSVDTADFGTQPLAGMQYQQQLEQMAFAMGGGNYKAPVQTVGAFLKGDANSVFGAVAPSYSIGTTPVNFAKLFSPSVLSFLQTGIRRFGGSLNGFAAPDAVLTGVETRTSSPVRIVRDKDSLQAQNTAGLYPCGEGAGYAGGIMSAAVDGLKTAQKLIEAFAPID